MAWNGTWPDKEDLTKAAEEVEDIQSRLAIALGPDGKSERLARVESLIWGVIARMDEQCSWPEYESDEDPPTMGDLMEAEESVPTKCGCGNPLNLRGQTQCFDCQKKDPGSIWYER